MGQVSIREGRRGDCIVTTDNKAIARAFYEAANGGELPRSLELLADDVTWTNIGSTLFSGTFTGKQTVMDNLLVRVLGYLQAGIQTTIENVIGEGEYVVVQSRGRAVTRSGEAYDNTYCHVFRIRNRRIVSVTEYMDTELMSRVLVAE
jgi:ketosteroid isomerase-like protein